MSDNRFGFIVQDHKNMATCLDTMSIITIIIIVFNLTVGSWSIQYLSTQYFGTVINNILALVLGFFLGTPAALLAAFTWVLVKLSEIL